MKLENSYQSTLEQECEIFGLLEYEFEEWLEKWLERGNDYIQALSLLNKPLSSSKRVLCLSVADGDVVKAEKIYSTWLMKDVLEWQAIKLATSYQNKEKDNGIR